MPMADGGSHCNFASPDFLAEHDRPTATPIMEPAGSDRKRPRRDLARSPASLQLGQRVRCRFLHEGQMTWFTGTIYEERKEGYMVKFDDKDTKLMSQFSIEPVVPALHQYELKQEVKPKSTCLPDTKPDLKVDSSDAFRSLERKCSTSTRGSRARRKKISVLDPSFARAR